jgi:hypothetical protein
VDGGMTLYPNFASNEEHNTEKHSNRTSKKVSNQTKQESNKKKYYRPSIIQNNNRL